MAVEICAMGRHRGTKTLRSSRERSIQRCPPLRRLLGGRMPFFELTAARLHLDVKLPSYSQNRWTTKILRPHELPRKLRALHSSTGVRRHCILRDGTHNRCDRTLNDRRSAYMKDENSPSYLAAGAKRDLSELTSNRRAIHRLGTRSTPR